PPVRRLLVKVIMNHPAELHLFLDDVDHVFAGEDGGAAVAAREHQPSGDVAEIAESPHLHARRMADRADDRAPEVDADAEPQLDAEMPLRIAAELGHAGSHAERRAHRAEAL